jgi:Membrane bound O-acyl transferase family
MLRMSQTDAEDRATSQSEHFLPATGLNWPGWIPMLVLPVATMALRSLLAPWRFMWMLAVAIFFGCKWQTWWEHRRIADIGIGRSLGYLFAWPGMDAETFLDSAGDVPQPTIKEWIWASVKTASGGALLWGVVRRVPEGSDLLAGWVGMLGIILILHFGVFHILSLAWRSAGVDAPPIMQAPLSSASLSDFWGRRWNLGFRHLTHRLIFKPVRIRAGVVPAILLSFLASGVIHDLVISLPARGGYGLPTSYFVLQGFGVLFERGPLGKRLGLGSGIRGWLFAVIFAGAPSFILFHPLFVRGVILPFLSAIGAR